MKLAPSGEERLRSQLIEVYPDALPQVYDYLLHRLSGDRATAEDLTADTFMRAVAACQRGAVHVVTTAWLITVARNRLTDHWRAEHRRLRLTLKVVAESSVMPTSALCPPSMDEGLAQVVLRRLNPMQRAALTLRHVDGLSDAEVADCLGRSIAATETLLTRARTAFRREIARHDTPGEPS